MEADKVADKATPGNDKAFARKLMWQDVVAAMEIPEGSKCRAMAEVHATPTTHEREQFPMALPSTAKEQTKDKGLRKRHTIGTHQKL